MATSGLQWQSMLTFVAVDRRFGKTFQSSGLDFTALSLRRITTEVKALKANQILLS